MAIIHVGPSERNQLTFSKNGDYLVNSVINNNDNFYVINSNKLKMNKQEKHLNMIKL